MSLEDIPEVQIPLDEYRLHFKTLVFILLEGLNGKYYLHSDPCITHKGCYKFRFLEYLKQKGIEPFQILSKQFPIGGGRISIDTEKRILHAYGKSEDYGKFDINIVKRLLENNFKEFKVIVD